MQLPKSAQEIADVIGDERALFLIGRLPRCYAHGKTGSSWDSGKRVPSERVIMYVPKRLDFDHVLVKILGWQDAQRLVDVFGGEILCPPTCAAIYRPFRDEHIARLVMEGVPVTMVAEWFGVSDRLVRNLTREKPQEDRRAANDNNRAFDTPMRRADDAARTQSAA